MSFFFFPNESVMLLFEASPNAYNTSALIEGVSQKHGINYSGSLGFFLNTDSQL